jgi:hypothetical protein
MPERNTVAQEHGEDGMRPSYEPYEKWSKEELIARARELGLQGRTLMTKAQLVKALRNR